MIKLDQITKYYKSNDLIAVGIRKINLEFKIGEFVAITGESGSGKSTLLNILSGLDTFEEGEFFLYGKPTSHYTVTEWESYRAQYVGFVFQNYNIIDSYTVFQNVLLALEFQGYDKETRTERALELIEKVGLTSRLHHRASKLSGGEKQRTVIARALAKDCPAILCDEPTGNLDSKTSEDILKLLYEISQDKLVIIVTHNYEEVEKYVTRRIKMSDGEIIEDIDLDAKQILIEERIETKIKQVYFWTSVGIALRNIFATPKRFVFFMLLQFVFVFLVFLIYGTISSLAYQNQITPQPIRASEHQMIVQKLNNQPFTQSEIDMFKAKKYVQAVNDFESISTLFSTIDREPIFSERVEVLKRGDLSKGRFPANESEIVISADLVVYLGVDINQPITLKTLNNEEFEYQIVGISSKVSSAVYFHKDFFNNKEMIFKSIVQTTGLTITDLVNSNSLTTTYRMIYENSDLLEGTAIARVYYELPGQRNTGMVMETGYGTKFDISLATTFIYTERERTLFVDSNTYDEFIEHFTDPSLRYKIVLNVYDQYDGTRLMKEIDQTEFIVYYKILTPNSGATSFGIILRVASYASILFVAMFMFTLLRFVFKNMVATRRKDFAIFRSVGANQKFLSFLVVMEQVIQILIGTALTFIIVLILVLSNDKVESIMKFISILDIIVVLAIFSYMTIRTPVKFNQMIFEISVIDTLRSSTEV
ncbi:MAG: ABC transporter ATP-binding protein/permease [Acholeplasmataceae bacterium]|nr:ABC transporter ATP-binding protein/permease [Acholeplasmataceae bacterium]